MMDIENPLPTLQKLSICTLIKAIQGFSIDVRLAEGCISEKAMYRAIIEPIQLTDYDIDYKNNENKYQLQFQFSPNFLLNNYGFSNSTYQSIKSYSPIFPFGNNCNISKK